MPTTTPPMKSSTIPSDPVAAASSALASNKNLNWTGLDWRPNLSLPPRQRIEEWIQNTRTLYNDPEAPKFAFSFDVDSGLRILSLTPAENTGPKRPLITKAVFGLTVPFAMATARGVLNGGFAGVIVDRLSALLLVGAAQEGFWDKSAGSTGMSLFWHVPVLLGEEVEVEVEIENINGSSCILSAKIRKAKDKVVCVTAQHQMRALKALSGSSKARL